MAVNPTTATYTLIKRVSEKDSEACQLLSLIYYPVVYGWARRAGCEHAFAEDIVQEVVLTVFLQVDPERDGRFRGWLWTLFRHRMVDLLRRSKNQPKGMGGTTANLSILEIEEPRGDALDGKAASIDEAGVAAILALKSEFSENVWNSFWRTAVHGDAAADVAADLGISIWAVYKGKKRCQARIKKTLQVMGVNTPRELLV